MRGRPNGNRSSCWAIRRPSLPPGYGIAGSGKQNASPVVSGLMMTSGTPCLMTSLRTGPAFTRPPGRIWASPAAPSRKQVHGELPQNPLPSRQPHPGDEPGASVLASRHRAQTRRPEQVGTLVVAGLGDEPGNFLAGRTGSEGGSTVLQEGRDIHA